MMKRTIKVLLFHCFFDGVAEVVLEIRQVFLQDVNLFVVDVGAWTLASVFIGHWLVINFDAEVVLGYIVGLIEQYVTDELCYVDVLRVALDVVNGQLSKFDVHNYFCFWSADDSAGVVCLKLLIALISATTLATSSSVGRSL